MAKLFNRVKQSTATTGTGTIALGAAAAGFQTLAQAGAVTGDVVPYFIEDGTAWEAGEGVYDAAGPALTRVLIESSTGALLDLSGGAVMFVAVPASSTGQSGKSTLVTGSGTHTLDPATKFVRVVAVGGGGGGSSGARQATATGRCGGGAGQPGVCIDRFFTASSLGSRDLVIAIGAGGIGAPGATTDSANGTQGGNGGATTITCAGVVILTARRGISGGGGGVADNSGFASTSAQFPASGVLIYHNFGAAGRTQNGNASAGAAFSPGAGGGGGGASGGNTASATGGTGGSLPLVIADGANPALGTTGNGANGSNFVLDGLPCGGGGAGGGYITGQTGKNGGNGGLYGGGGGGGGASDNGFTSGAGGNGAQGAVFIMEFF